MTSLLLFCGAGETLEKQPDVWSHLQLHLSQPQPLVFWAPEISRGTSWVWLIDFRVRTMKIGKWVYSLVLKTFEQVKLNGEYMLVWLQTNQKKKKKKEPISTRHRDVCSLYWNYSQIKGLWIILHVMLHFWLFGGRLLSWTTLFFFSLLWQRYLTKIVMVIPTVTSISFTNVLVAITNRCELPSSAQIWIQTNIFYIK